MDIKTFEKLLMVLDKTLMQFEDLPLPPKEKGPEMDKWLIEMMGVENAQREMLGNIDRLVEGAPNDQLYAKARMMQSDLQSVIDEQAPILRELFDGLYTG